MIRLFFFITALLSFPGIYAQEFERIDSLVRFPDAQQKALADSLATDTVSQSVTAFDTVKSVVPLDSARIVHLDSLQKVKKAEKRHSATKAAWMSAVCPGLGQGYNRKYWKIPIVYAGLGGLGYGIYHFGSRFIGFRNAYRIAVDGDSTTNSSYRGISSTNALKEYRDYHKRNLDIISICTVVWYLLNIVDAAVDGHLYDWNMDDKLSMHIEPLMQPTNGAYSFGIGLTFQPLTNINKPVTRLGF